MHTNHSVGIAARTRAFHDRQGLTGPEMQRLEILAETTADSAGFPDSGPRWCWILHHYGLSRLVLESIRRRRPQFYKIAALQAS